MIREALAEGSSSWTLGEYAVSIRSDLRSTASLPPHQLHIPTIEGRSRQRRLKLWYNISAFSEEDVGLRNRAGGPSRMMLI